MVWGVFLSLEMGHRIMVSKIKSLLHEFEIYIMSSYENYCNESQLLKSQIEIDQFQVLQAKKTKVFFLVFQMKRGSFKNCLGAYIKCEIMLITNSLFYLY